jgi:hypothetical protein
MAEVGSKAVADLLMSMPFARSKNLLTMPYDRELCQKTSRRSSKLVHSVDAR